MGIPVILALVVQIFICSGVCTGVLEIRASLFVLKLAWVIVIINVCTTHSAITHYRTQLLADIWVLHRKWKTVGETSKNDQECDGCQGTGTQGCFGIYRCDDCNGSGEKMDKASKPRMSIHTLAEETSIHAKFLETSSCLRWVVPVSGGLLLAWNCLGVVIYQRGGSWAIHETNGSCADTFLGRNTPLALSIYDRQQPGAAPYWWGVTHLILNAVTLFLFFVFLFLPAMVCPVEICSKQVSLFRDNIHAITKESDENSWDIAAAQLHILGDMLSKTWSMWSWVGCLWHMWLIEAAVGIIACAMLIVASGGSRGSAKGGNATHATNITTENILHVMEDSALSLGIEFFFLGVLFVFLSCLYLTRVNVDDLVWEVRRKSTEMVNASSGLKAGYYAFRTVLRERNEINARFFGVAITKGRVWVVLLHVGVAWPVFYSVVQGVADTAAKHV